MLQILNQFNEPGPATPFSRNVRVEIFINSTLIDEPIFPQRYGNSLAIVAAARPTPAWVSWLHAEKRETVAMCHLFRQDIPNPALRQAYHRIGRRCEGLSTPPNFKLRHYRALTPVFGLKDVHRFLQDGIVLLNDGHPNARHNDHLGARAVRRDLLA